MHNDDADEPRMRQAGSAISGNDLFIKVTANKKRVHEQEPVLLTYKVYTQADLTQLDGKMPDLKVFHSQEVPQPQLIVLHNEVINGRPYRCVTWSHYVMYPQMTGNLEIPSITFKGIVVQQNRNVDPIEAFFNGGSGYVEVHKSIKAPGITIQVDPLPARPANFSGGVGRFNISATLDKNDVKAGDPINIRVVVGGIGNLKLLKQPVLNLPKDFDQYDAKITDKTKLTQNGVEGNMVYDFLAVPRNQGKYTIPSVEFTYYDTKTNAYRTIKTQPFTLTVEQGDGTDGSSSANYSNADKDIHALKLGKSKLCDIDDMFYGSFGYWTSLMVPLIAFIGLLIAFRRRAIENADIVKMRSNKANKIATKRLKKARTLMLARKQGEFYDEVLRALWGYVSYKLNMPVEQLSRENIQDKLLAHSVDADTIEKFTQALDECEFERYAPGDPAGNMNKTFDSAMTAIMEIENAIKAARKYSFDHYGKGRDVVITLVNSFHGRTIATLTATGQEVFHNYFGPFNEGFQYVPAGDLEALTELVDRHTCAVMLELVQGEGGVVALEPEYVQAVRKLCDDRDLVLIVDEVQTGVGRTGTFLCCEHYNLKPDVVTLAKGLGGGLPIGAVLMNEKVAAGMGAGTHGSTFGGNPVVCAGANVVVDRMDQSFLANVNERAVQLRAGIAKLPHVKSISGIGLMVGIEFYDLKAADVLAACREAGLLVLTAKTRLRLLPPLTLTAHDVEKALAILNEVLSEMAQKSPEEQA